MKEKLKPTLERAVADLTTLLADVATLETTAKRLAETEAQAEVAEARLVEVNGALAKATKQHTEQSQAQAKARETWDAEIRERQQTVRDLQAQAERLHKEHGQKLELVDVTAALETARREHREILESLESLRRRFVG
jgi:hypothetical protein